MLTICVVGVVVVASLLAWRAFRQDDAVPYDDPQSGGLLSLCGADGKPVTPDPVLEGTS